MPHCNTPPPPPQPPPFHPLPPARPPPADPTGLGGGRELRGVSVSTRTELVNGHIASYEGWTGSMQPHNPIICDAPSLSALPELLVVGVL